MPPINVPDRSDDSAEAFARQQEEIARQVREAKSRAAEAELQEILRKGR